MVQIKEANSSPKELSKSRESDWPTVLFLIHVHLLSLYGIYLVLYEAKIITIVFMLVLVLFANLGVTAGAHRLWAHRSYKATTSLRVFLMLLQTLAGQGPIYDWVQYHRLHHAKFGTDGDPYNHNKGFFYAHITTRLRHLSPYQEDLLKQIDVSDLEKDSVVMFQKKAYWVLYLVLFALLPLNAPLEYWNESVVTTVFVIGFLRYGLLLHLSWLVESGIEIWGLKSNEKYPHDSNSVFILTKTFWPQYHYIVPYDYKTGEMGSYGSGCTCSFIRVWAALQLASDLRTVSSSTVQAALASAAKTKRPVAECINEAVQHQQLPEDHYLNVKS